MKRILFIFIVVALACLPVAAQDTAPAPMDNNEIVLTGALFVVVALFGIFGAVLATLAGKLANALPPWAVDMLQMNLDRLMDEIARRAEETPGTSDDEYARRIRAELEKLGLLKPE